MTSSKTPSKPDSRLVAVKALGRILGLDEQLESTLNSDPGFSALEGRDRGFVRLLVSSFFRHKGQIDKVIGQFVKSPPPDFVMNALRIGSVQLLILGTADHAAVGETVGLLKSHKKYYKFSGLANAVLRKVAREGKQIMAGIPPRENIPIWIYKGWERAYGKGPARQMALEYQKVPPLDISVKSNPEEWAEKLGGDVLYGNSIRLPKAGQIRELEGYEEGEWWVQDLASSLPVQFLEDLNGKRVLDMCAAPGGKTLQLAARGADVTAVDKSNHRLGILNDNLGRTKLTANIIEADAARWEDPAKGFDIVLLDAPCSATGTFRRHPDVLHAKSWGQIEGLKRLQWELLLSAAGKLRPGGILVYCTCSLQVEEGEAQIDKFVQKHKDFEVIRFLDEKWREYGTPGGYLRLLPHQMREKGGLDGFFIAILRLNNKQM